MLEGNPAFTAKAFDVRMSWRAVPAIVVGTVADAEQCQHPGKKTCSSTVISSDSDVIGEDGCRINGSSTFTWFYTNLPESERSFVQSCR
jgi:hypothetical protein